ncbi:MAG: nucleotidyltransferase domain-containing protein [Anaerolineaceae bacterium]|nr:nucleotidyltransferase domain-containing protein [Anaerolineaceae bacterium]
MTYYNLLFNLKPILDDFDHPDINGIMLMGSFARGTAHQHSDIDILRLIPEGDNEKIPHGGTFYYQDHLLIISDIIQTEVEKNFTLPGRICDSIHGFRSMKPLIDRNGMLEKIKIRADQFEWTPKLKKKAHENVSKQMVGWIEEVHKGLNGLETNHIGRLINARFGLSWGLSNVIKIYHGILLTSDNGIYEDIENYLGKDTDWCLQRNQAFGIMDKSTMPVSIQQQIQAGLRLYQLTANMVSDALHGHSKELINNASNRINQALQKK